MNSARACRCSCLEKVRAELIQSKNQDSRSARYLKDLGQKLTAFVTDPLFAGRLIHEITTPELDRWIRSLKVIGTTPQRLQAGIGRFVYVRRPDGARANPVLDVEPLPNPMRRSNTIEHLYLPTARLSAIPVVVCLSIRSLGKKERKADVS